MPTSRTTSSGFTTWWPRRAHWMYEALMSRELPDHDGERVKARLPVEVEVIGELSVEDGLVVSDPFSMGAGLPVIRQPLIGSPYQVAVAKAMFDTGSLVAAALLFSSSGQVARWEMATWEDGEPRSFEGDEYQGIAVSSTSVCFVSLSAARVIGPILAADNGQLEDPVSRVMFTGLPDSPDAALIEVRAGTPPIAVFRAGWGDGIYPTWLGLDAHGQVAVALLDLLVTNDPYMVP